MVYMNKLTMSLLILLSFSLIFLSGCSSLNNHHQQITEHQNISVRNQKLKTLSDWKIKGKKWGVQTFRALPIPQWPRLECFEVPNKDVRSVAGLTGCRHPVHRAHRKRRHLARVPHKQTLPAGAERGGWHDAKGLRPTNVYPPLLKVRKTKHNKKGGGGGGGAT